MPVGLAPRLGPEPADRHPAPCRAALATLQPKIALFRQMCAAAPDAADLLGCLLQACPDTQAALALPLDDFGAALRFIERQLALLPSRSPTAAAAAAAAAAPAAAAAAAAPAAAAAAAEAADIKSLHAYFKRHPLVAGAVLQQHPAPFEQHAAPWLRQQLLWSDSQVAAAALLSGRMPELCRLSAALAQASLDWLVGQGLTQQQAGRLLLAGLRTEGDLLTAGSAAELASRQARIGQLAQRWRLTPALAAALWLAQPFFLSSTREELTGRLALVLQVPVARWFRAESVVLVPGGMRCRICITLFAAVAAGLHVPYMYPLLFLLLACAEGCWHDGRAAAGVCAGRRPAVRLHRHASAAGCLAGPAQTAAAGGWCRLYCDCRLHGGLFTGQVAEGWKCSTSCVLQLHNPPASPSCASTIHPTGFWGLAKRGNGAAASARAFRCSPGSS